MTAIRQVLDTSRPRFWLYLAGPVLVGVAHGAQSVAELAAIPAVVLFGYFLFPANLYLYGVNDIFDARIDRKNPKKTSGRERRFRGEFAVVFAALFGGLLGLGIVFLVPESSRYWILGFLVLGAAYSVPPVRLKTVPIFDSVSNGLYILPGVAAYVAVADGHPPIAIVAGSWVWAMAMHTFSAIPDIAADRRAGITTTATVLGERPTVVYCGVCWVLAAIAFGLVDWRAGILLGVYPTVLVIIATSAIDIDRAYWWYPAMNAAVGAVLTLAGLWSLPHD